MKHHVLPHNHQHKYQHKQYSSKLRASASGYVLVLTLLLLSMSVVIITAVVQRALVYQKQARILLDRERARTLALGALELALSQITPEAQQQQQSQAAPTAQAVEQQEPKKSEQAQESKEKLTPEQKWLARILSSINRWQTVTLTDKAEGIDATIRLYISAEQGKLNLRALTRKRKKEPEQAKAPALEKPTGAEATAAEQEAKTQTQAQETEAASPASLDALIKKKLGVSILQAIRESSQQLGRMVDDPAELIKAKSFAAARDKLFASYSASNQKKEGDTVTVMDLFTTVAGPDTLNPWLLSSSLKSVLGFTLSTGAKDSTALVKQMKPSMNWETDWDTVLAPLYGKKFHALDPEIRALLAPQFEASAFSVIAYAHVGKITQKVYALFETSNQVPKAFKLTKLYWL